MLGVRTSQTACREQTPGFLREGTLAVRLRKWTREEHEHEELVVLREGDEVTPLEPVGGRHPGV